MSVRNAVIAGTFVAALTAPAAALAATGYTTGDVNMRTGPSTRYHRILTIPEGSRIEIRGCGSWCSVTYRGRTGYVSGNYVSRGSGYVSPPVFHGPSYVPAPTFRGAPPPPPGGWHRRPWWDSRHNAWYDGDRWYFGGRWHDRPSGFSFGFGFGS